MRDNIELQEQKTEKKKKKDGSHLVFLNLLANEEKRLYYISNCLIENFF